MSEMVERVSRAMWLSVHWSPDMPSFAHEVEWDDVWPDGYETFRTIFRTQARAAIEAMREPTEEMVEASWTNTVAVTPAERMALALGASKDAHCLKARRRYTAMIDAALSHQPTPQTEGEV